MASCKQVLEWIEFDVQKPEYLGFYLHYDKYGVWQKAWWDGNQWANSERHGTDWHSLIEPIYWADVPEPLIFPI